MIQHWLVLLGLIIWCFNLEYKYLKARAAYYREMKRLADDLERLQNKIAWLDCNTYLKLMKEKLSEHEAKNNKKS